MRYPVIKDTHSHDNFVIWCVSTAYTCIWTTEEHRFWGPGSVLMRLSTTQGRYICNTGEQHPHWALSSHCCLLNSKLSQPPWLCTGLETFGILSPIICHRTTATLPSSSEVYLTTERRALKKRGFWPHTCRGLWNDCSSSHHLQHSYFYRTRPHQVWAPFIHWPCTLQESSRHIDKGK